MKHPVFVSDIYCLRFITPRHRPLASLTGFSRIVTKHFGLISLLSSQNSIAKEIIITYKRTS
jgi:hypothetical protein